MYQPLLFQEYAVKHENDSFIKKRKCLLLLLYIVPFSLLAIRLILHALFPLLILAILADLILILLTWPLTSIDYDYIIENGVLSFYVIYRQGSRTRKVRAPLKDARAIVPATEETLAKYYAPSEKKFDFRSSEDAPHPYLIQFVNEKDQVTAVLFNGFYQMIDQCRSLHFAVTTLDPSLPLYD